MWSDREKKHNIPLLAPSYGSDWYCQQHKLDEEGEEIERKTKKETKNWNLFLRDKWTSAYILLFVTWKRKISIVLCNYKIETASKIHGWCMQRLNGPSKWFVNENGVISISRVWIGIVFVDDIDGVRAIQLIQWAD